MGSLLTSAPCGALVAVLAAVLQCPVSIIGAHARSVTWAVVEDILAGICTVHVKTILSHTVVCNLLMNECTEVTASNE